MIRPAEFPLVSPVRYVSDGTWFDIGTEAFLLVDCGIHGLFVGLHNGDRDEETCPWEEFVVLGLHSE